MVYRGLLEQELDEIVGSEVVLLRQASEHVIRAGGKRIRPRLVVLAYQACGGQVQDEPLRLAAAVELIHTASLVHDDINDRSHLRRGRTTVNARWGNSCALLAGDYLFCKAMKLAADLEPRIIHLLADACISIVEGETRQLLSLGDMEMSEETYLDIVAQKTASLFAACTEAGAILAGAPREEAAALRKYGLNLGIAFQIRDDTLDGVGLSDELGKPVASDLDQEKVSLAAVVALRRSDAFKELVRDHDTRGAVQLLHEMGCFEYAMSRAHQYAQVAKAALSPLQPSAARSELYELADFAVDRKV